MHHVHLPMAPLLFVPAFALIGAANNQREWLGALVGGAIGLFFALGAMGLLSKRMADLLGPVADDKTDKELPN